MDWLQIFVNLVLTGILLYIFQKVIDERSEKRLEKFKTELRSSAFVQETKFSKLHEIHLVVAAELHKKLFQLRETLTSLKLFFDPNFFVDIAAEKILNDAYEAERDLKLYFQSNRLYVPESVCARIDVICNHYSVILKTLSDIMLDIRISKLPDESAVRYLKEHNEELLKSWLVLSEQITPLLTELERDFRNLLGS